MTVNDCDCEDVHDCDDEVNDCDCEDVNDSDDEVNVTVMMR